MASDSKDRDANKCDDPFQLSGFNQEEPIALASRGAFPPNDAFDIEAYYSQLARVRAKIAHRPKIANSTVNKFNDKTLVALVERMRNGLSETSDKTRKAVLKSEFGLHESDTGGTEVQAAFLTARIEKLHVHLEAHPKDNHSRRGLVLMSNRRKRLLKYLMKRSTDRYKTLIRALGIRGHKL